MPPGNIGLALGAMADAIGQSRIEKQQQEHADNLQHQNLIHQAIRAGLEAGAFDDPGAAFQFLLDGGKPNKKGQPLPPMLQTVITAAQRAQQPSGGDGPGYVRQDVDRVAAASQTAAAGAGGELPAPVVGLGGAGGGPPAAVQAPAPAPVARPSVPGTFRYLSPDEIAARNLEREKASKLALADIEREIQGKDLDAKVAILKRYGYSDHDAVLVGLGHTLPAAVPRWVGGVVPAKNVPDDATGIDGRPIDPDSAEAFKVGLRADGTVVYSPTTLPGATAPKSANLNARLVELKALPENKGKSDDELLAVASRQLINERAVAADQKAKTLASMLSQRYQSLINNQANYEYMRVNHPLLLKAHQLGITLTGANIDYTRARAALTLAATPGTGVTGQDPKVIEQKLKDEGLDENFIPPAVANPPSWAIKPEQLKGVGGKTEPPATGPKPPKNPGDGRQWLSPTGLVQWTEKSKSWDPVTVR